MQLTFNFQVNRYLYILNLKSLRIIERSDRARGVAWFILVALGAIDSGSNPGGPIQII